LVNSNSHSNFEFKVKIKFIAVSKYQSLSIMGRGEVH
jgi:hypothetical protein